MFDYFLARSIFLFSCMLFLFPFAKLLFSDVFLVYISYGGLDLFDLQNIVDSTYHFWRYGSHPLA